jgi:hypothetical protein
MCWRRRVCARNPVSQNLLQLLPGLYDDGPLCATLIARHRIWR